MTITRFSTSICGYLLLTTLASGQNAPVAQDFHFESQPWFTISDPNAPSDSVYEVLRSTDLQSWTPFSQAFNGSSSTTFIPLPERSSDQRYFYKAGRLLTSSARAALAPVDEDYYDDGAPDLDKVDLGRLLFWDKELSGNRNISCASCHHPDHGTGDGLSLPVGEGGVGIGPTRSLGTIDRRVGRNSPPLFNLGAKEFSVMFADGRVSVSNGPGSTNGFLSPATVAIPTGLDNVLAAQALFPVNSEHEMAGHQDENAVGYAAIRHDFPKVWELLAERLQAISGYVTRFVNVFPDVNSASDITFTHAANAMAAHQAWTYRADESPFDEYLRGDDSALTSSQKRGMRLFYGEARCATCHTGKFQTDHSFHAIGMVQIGPAKDDFIDFVRDTGRIRRTFSDEDNYRFRTPSLRNVEITGPYGHAGAYADLESVVRHHLDPISALTNYDPSQVVLTPRSDLDEDDFRVVDNEVGMLDEIINANELLPVSLNNSEVDDIVNFLHSLTDPASLTLQSTIPSSVPSGLPVNP